ncbi:MAG: thioredoxin [Bacteroidota bacterium]
MKKETIVNALIVVLLLSLFSCKSDKKKDVTTLNADNFVSETSKGVVLVDFWATWCMPCKAMAPVIDEIAGQTIGKVKVGKVDIDANGPLANQFGIQAIPALLIFKDGKLMESLVGVQSKAAVINALSKYTPLQ